MQRLAHWRAAFQKKYGAWALDVSLNSTDAFHEISPAMLALRLVKLTPAVAQKSICIHW